MRLFEVPLCRGENEGMLEDPDGICVSTASCGLAATSATQFVVAEEEEAIRVRVKVVRDDPVLEDKWHRVRPRR